MDFIVRYFFRMPATALGFLVAFACMAVSAAGEEPAVETARVEVPMPGEDHTGLYAKAPVVDSAGASGSLPGAFFAWYGRVSKKTVHRCPFHTSCSNFARSAVKRYGLFFGTLRFIDRYYFREHSAAERYYRKRMRDGRRLLDDDFFLEGKPSSSEAKE